MSKYSYELGISALGSHYLTVEHQNDRTPPTSCPIYGQGIIDQLSLLFLACAGFLFPGLRPVRVKLLTINQEQNLHVKLPTLYATVNSVARIVKYQLRDYAQLKHYNYEEENLDHFIYTGLENRSIINLHHASFLMEKQMDLNFHTKWKDIFEFFAENFQKMIDSPNAPGFSVFINDEGEIAQNAAEATLGNWHEIKFGLDEDESDEEGTVASSAQTPNEDDPKKGLLVERFKMEFPPRARSYYLQKLFETWHTLLNNPTGTTGTTGITPPDGRETHSDLIKEAISKVTDKLYELEFHQYVINPVESDDNQIMLTLAPRKKPEIKNDDAPADAPVVDPANPVESPDAADSANNEEELTIPLNAHRIDIGDISYIARSEPSENFDSIIRFWQMMQQEQSPLIVKLRNGGTNYWPAISDGTVRLNDDLAITCLEMNVHPLYPFMERVFLLGKPGEEQKVIRQIECNGWPDMSVPDESVMQELLNWVDIRRQELGMTKNTPITVHCAAGVGRTGTFIASHAIKQNPQLKTLDIVNSMREQRPFPMVENVKQYLFIQKMRTHFRKLIGETTET